jgi:hypothetical protein
MTYFDTNFYMHTSNGWVVVIKIKINANFFSVYITNSSETCVFLTCCKIKLKGPTVSGASVVSVASTSSVCSAAMLLLLTEY